MRGAVDTEQLEFQPFILFCHIAKVLKVSPFEVCADLGMLCKKRL